MRVSVMEYDSCTTGVNCSIFGYMSNGEIVPEVMTTELNRSKTVLIAIEGSRQLVRQCVSQQSPRGDPSWRAREVKDWVWHCGIIRFKWLKDEKEA